MTYRQTLELFKDAAQTLEGIEDFRYGAPWEIQQTKDLNYPCIYFEASNLITISKPGSKTQTISLYFVDIPLQGAGGEQQYSDYNGKMLNTLSKMEQLVHQYMQVIDPNLNRVTNYNMTPILENYADRTWGWRVEFTVTYPFKWSDCYLTDLYLPCESSGTLDPSYFESIPMEWISLDSINYIFVSGQTGQGTIEQLIGTPLCADTLFTIYDTTEPTYFSAAFEYYDTLDGVKRYLLTYYIDYDYINAHIDIDFSFKILVEGCCEAIPLTFQTIFGG